MSNKSKISGDNIDHTNIKSIFNICLNYNIQFRYEIEDGERLLKLCYSVKDGIEFISSKNKTLVEILSSLGHNLKADNLPEHITILSEIDKTLLFAMLDLSVENDMDLVINRLASFEVEVFKERDGSDDFNHSVGHSRIEYVTLLGLILNSNLS